MNNKSKTNLAIAAAVLGVSAIGTAAAAEGALLSIIGRKDLLNMKKSKGYMGQVSRSIEEHKDVIAVDKRVFDELPEEKVKIYSGDGIQLVGHWMQAKNPRRTLVLMHGFRSSWNHDFCSAAKFFLDNGCNLLFAEHRAHGESGGKYIGYGILERYDCVEWLKYAELRCGGSLPIYAHGISMGATTVLMASELKMPGNVVGIIADSGFTSPADIIAHTMKGAYKLPEKPILPILSAMCKAVAGYGFYDRSTLDALKHNTRPVLFIHGEADGFVPCEMSERSYAAVRGDKDIVIVPGAGHGLSYLTDREKCEKALLSFFEKCDS